MVDNRSMDIRTVTGVVKGGVIVPDTPLAEGTYVEMTVPNAPREIVERVRWDRSDSTPISRTVEGVPLEVGRGVDELLHFHDAEEMFTRVCKWIEDCFPGHTRIDVGLVEDGDAPGFVRVCCTVTLPSDY